MFDVDYIFRVEEVEINEQEGNVINNAVTFLFDPVVVRASATDFLDLATFGWLNVT